jgi:membrane-anchored protein YejM (alkaline phosphatase superfamily)
MKRFSVNFRTFDDFDPFELLCILLLSVVVIILVITMLKSAETHSTAGIVDRLWNEQHTNWIKVGDNVSVPITTTSYYLKLKDNDTWFTYDNNSAYTKYLEPETCICIIYNGLNYISSLSLCKY